MGAFLKGRAFETAQLSLFLALNCGVVAPMPLTEPEGADLTEALINASRSAPLRSDLFATMVTRRQWLKLFTAACGALSVGCASWKKEPAPAANSSVNLHGYKMPADSVVVEVAVVDMPADPQNSYQIWQQLDETQVDAQVRKRLSDNGFRIGVAPANLPIELAQLIETQEALQDIDSETGAMVPGVRGNRQRHQLRSGQTVQIATTPIADSLAWIMIEDGYRRGGSLFQAECQIALRGYPRRDGTVRVKLTPEIHHGAAKQSVDVASNTLIWRPTRDKQVFIELETSVDLRSGQVLVLGCTEDQRHLAHLFLAEPEAAEERRRKLILVRPVQTQLDDLFSREQRFQPLETPVE